VVESRLRCYESFPRDWPEARSIVAKVRVYELAQEFGVESKVVIDQLKEMGELVRSASSTIEAPVAQRFRVAYLFETRGAVPGQTGNNIGSRTSLPPDLPAKLPPGTLDDVSRKQDHRRVFISYVREDSHRVDRLRRTLQDAGVQVWRDTADLWPGEDWRAKIRYAIVNNAFVFIACFSRGSLARNKSYQNEELLLAIEQLRMRPPERPWLIPVRFDECEIPDWDIGASRTLSSIQRADLFGERYDEEEERLVDALLRILGRSSYGVTSSNPSQISEAQDHAALLLEEACRLAADLHGRERIPAFADLAQALAAVDSERAEFFLSEAEGIARYLDGGSASRRVVKVLASFDPDRAENLARIIVDSEERMAALADIATVVVADFRRIGRLAAEVIAEGTSATAVGRIAQVVATSDPDRAERLAQVISDSAVRAAALAGVAQTLTFSDPDRAIRLFIDSRRLASAISDRRMRASVLVYIATAMASSDSGQAIQLFFDAYGNARSYRYWSAEAAELAEFAVAISYSDPAEAIRFVEYTFSRQSLKWADRVRARIVEVMATSAADRAVRLAHEITDPALRAYALADIAWALTSSNPDRASRLIADAVRLTQTIKDTQSKLSALIHIAMIEFKRSSWIVT
jgi:TIR domain/Translation initiation factor IF-2, N-terminal region